MYSCIKLFSSIHFFLIFPLKESVRPWHKTCLFFAVSQKKTATVSMTPRSLSQRCQFYFRVWLCRLNDTAEFDFHHWHQSGSQIVLFFIRNKCKNVFKIYLRSIQLFLNMDHETKWTEIKKEEIFLKINAFFHSEGSMT